MKIRIQAKWLEQLNTLPNYNLWIDKIWQEQPTGLSDGLIYLFNIPTIGSLTKTLSLLWQP